MGGKFSYNLDILSQQTKIFLFWAIGIFIALPILAGPAVEKGLSAQRRAAAQAYVEKYYSGLCEKQPAAETGKSPYRAGQIFKTALYGELEVIKVCANGVSVTKTSAGSYDPFFVPRRDFATLRSGKIPEPELKKMQASFSESTTKLSRVCLSFRADGSLICTERARNDMTCPGDRNWGGPGSCANYKDKKVQHLDRKQWSDLIAVFTYDQAANSKTEEPKQQSKLERCQKACRQKKCGSRMSGEYTASVSSSLRCAGFCDQECNTDPERYR